MTLDSASLLLNMLLILVSVGAHQAGAGEFAFFLVTAIVCIVVWRREKAGRPLRLSDMLATILCVIAFIVLMWRGVAAATSGGGRMTDVGVAPVGDFLIVFQWVTLCRERKGHDYFWMYMVTLVHMGTAGLEMPGVLYGFFFIAYTFLAICALAAGHAALEARAVGPGAPGNAARPAGRGAVKPAMDLVGGPPSVDRWSGLGALAATPPILVVVAILFVFLPRTAATGTIAPAILRLGQQPTSGFSNTVRLGSIGQIQDNPTRVMHLVVRDPKTHAAIQLPTNDPGLLLRGLPLDAYVHEGNTWSWQLTPMPGSRWYRKNASEAPRLSYIYQRSFPGYDEAPYREITCDISLEPLDTPILFAPFAPAAFSCAKAMTVYANTRSYVLQTGLVYRRTPLNYTVTARLFDAAPPPAPPARTLPEEDLRPYLELPGELSPKIRALARQIVPASARTDYQKAERLLDYLADSNQFHYTTELSPTPGVEPVEDFLFNLKRGHCEYFASSLVVLLREVNVPARVVNGFKASEWNSIAGAYVVRQENAHSWVEAYLRPYGWRTLDPTAVSRDAASRKPMFARRIGRNIYDWTEWMWVSYVLNFDSVSHSGLYGLLQKIADRLQEWSNRPSTGFGGVGVEGYQTRGTNEGYYVILSALLWTALAAFSAVLAWLIARGIIRWRRRRREPRLFKFYARMERLLARHGFRRSGTQTPWEFSAALAAGRWPCAAEVAVITDRFCSARYGARPPTEADLRQIEQALHTISRLR